MPSSSSSSGGVESSSPTHHPSSSSMLTNDQLAAQLMQCAILVKKGDRGPLLRKTIHDLTDYLTLMPAQAAQPTTEAAPASPTRRPPPQPHAAPPATSGHNPPPQSGTSHASAASSASSSQLSKPTKAPFIAGLGKIMGLTDEILPSRSHESKAATSAKNAQRIKSDLHATSGGAPATQQQQQQHPASHDHHHKNWLGMEEPEWCEEHFTMGCACKTRRRSGDPEAAPTSSNTSSSSSGGVQQRHTATTAAASSSAAGAAATQASAAASTRGKPAFQRPSNPISALIANGWIEQQRRSKMRIVWKDVLASLVEGRRKGEETTLWIQREVIQERTGKVELEALHQIPIKLVEQVQFHTYSTENKFSIKVYNLPDEYVFRCRDEEAAQQWVLTLRSVQQVCRQQRSNKQHPQPTPTVAKVPTGVDEWEQQEREHQLRQQQQQEHEMRRVVSEEEKKAPEYQPHAASQSTSSYEYHSQQSSQNQPRSHRMTITELRAIAHGAGFNTHGMERGELEALVGQIAAKAGGAATATPPPPAAAAPHAPTPQPPTANGTTPGVHVPPEATRARTPPPANISAKTPTNVDGNSAVPPDDEILRRRQQQQQADEMERQRKIEEARRRQKQVAEEAKAAAAAARAVQQEAERQRLMAERVRAQQAADQKRRAEEEERKRLAEERQRRDEEEIQRRLAERQAAEVRRKQEEAQRLQQQQWQQQQQAWQKQQEEEEQRRRAAEYQAAEARRQQDEAYRRQQQWQQQQGQSHPQGPPNPQTYPPGGQPFQQQRPGPGYPSPPPSQGQPGFHPQQPPPQQGGYPGAVPPHGPQQPPHPGSAVNQKYAKMAQQSDDGAAIWNIKHGILIQWALLPPMLQVLRPIEDLLTSIHTVFPPKFGVPGHEYFLRWTAVTYDEISQGPALGNRPDDAKLKKAMRKLRFFLHPDKLPRDLSKEQTFMCKMLWDIISDAEAEHKKKEEELGWIRG